MPQVFSSPPLGVYVHVPFCASRCGYCDFNTYTPRELDGKTGPEAYLEALEKELAMAAAQLADSSTPGPAGTVFVGGGTPSLLGGRGLARIYRAIDRTIGIAPGAEVTTESNPESTDPGFFAAIREAGYNRVSLGMQSASAGVLEVLGRRHTPGRAVAAAGEAARAGFSHINLDMIYGTPTETDADVEATLDAVLSAGVDHVSAYSLIVEDGTAFARKVAKGILPAPDDDVLAHRYQLIDTALSGAGMQWYEVSNWAAPGGMCRHNMGYWCGANWWGAGPGAHSHIDGRRFFNVKHPFRYHAMLTGGQSAVDGGETLSTADRHTEEIMLGLRLRQGIDISRLSAAAQAEAAAYSRRGLLHTFRAAGTTRLAVTGAGRLLADGIIAALLAAED
ncbi:radical SAM family heme chaperone HemW [Corynebacterium mendelii]|uniref:Heme chaperone HemW n=1 Tax=Corynebacterium mendelii TaxID=2765362 RepID=A0A939DZP8_9CORY|nr:radical SAM family heme chaperone HemW [Corynebacterium mendelii]MBN9644229.1 coproporphyrinogen III oxidase [Corynebacterium mendelii]